METSAHPFNLPNPGRELPLEDYKRALERNGGRLNDTARELGVSRVTLAKKLKQHESLRDIQRRLAAD